ncbi:GbsR/MarR family transcriptional regulator [Parapedobacter deserti]|uniref:GbsR/MarR family transcriptional regulator n=1 Tax=Parapedobacter deserti TaxID=1912957 RepID=A0ABV7JFJ9_9SPHI
MEHFRNKIEQHAKTIEEMGLSPVPARVYIYLLFSDPPGATFEEMVNYFGISKSAISNALKMLQTVGMIDSRTFSGKRRRYFYVNFERTFNQQFMTSRFMKMKQMLDDIRAVRNKDDGFSKDMEHASLLYKMLLVELPIVLERWERTIKLEDT